ncbi:MAG: restriction endonuclease subunit S [Planctomycetaceae bacterium]|nr:restriction endonuclease subunit S [Planctomycetaceae bacterium]
MSFPAYEHFQDSGRLWLGEFPAHWESKPLWTMFRRTKRTGFGDEELLSVYRDYGVIPKSSRDDNFNKPSEDLSTYQLVEPSDLVINKMKAWQGSVAISEHRGIVSPAYHVYECLHDECSRYLHHLMRSLRYITGYLSMSKGIRINQWDLEPQLHSRMPVLLPPPDEQKAISSFLDVETSKIDGLVSEQRRLIELLKEKRQAIISHAVTKGLNPNAPMKPSGIQWLGNLPEHWPTEMISRIATKIGNGYVGPTRDILVESGIPYVQATHIKNGRVNFDGEYFVTPEWSETQSKATLELGDVLIVQTGAGTGDIGLVSEEEVGYSCHALIIVRANTERILGSFLAVALQSQYGVQTLESIQTGGMHPHLNCGNVKFVHVPIPPIEEQRVIVDYVNEKLKRFSLLQAEAERAIELLQERRTALISAAVTGKIDVRHFANKGAA